MMGRCLLDTRRCAEGTFQVEGKSCTGTWGAGRLHRVWVDKHFPVVRGEYIFGQIIEVLSPLAYPVSKYSEVS